MKRKMMVAALSLTLSLTLALPLVNAGSAEGEKNIIKETSPGVYVAAQENLSFAEVNSAMKEIHAKNREKRLKQDKVRQKELGLEGTEPVQSGELQTPSGIQALSGEIQGGTREWLHSGYGFDYVVLTASTVWANYPTYSSWDYFTQGYTRPNFASAMVSTTMGLYGLTTDWPPVYKEYTHESDWVSDNYSVSISGDDWGFGVFAYASASSYLKAAPKGTGNYHTFNY